MDTIFEQKFSANEVAEAARIAPSTLQNWLKRNVIVGHKKEIEGGGSQGRHRKFSFFSLIEIATAAALVRGGIADLATAFSASAGFAHAGHGELPNQPERIPGLPFDTSHGFSLLVVSGERQQTFLWKPGEDVFAKIRAAFRGCECLTIVDMTALFDRVCHAVGVHPEDVLDSAYGKKGAD